ncbi:MAG: proline--tRNA ligase [Myxococcota bacterium]
MRLSRAFIPTLKETPKDAVDASHVLLLRGGFIRMVGAGIYEMLPLGQRVLTKIANIVRDEMNDADAQEILMPALLPASYFQETGRWDVYGDVLVRIKDRKGGDYHLGPTHEEIVTDLVRREVKSYRQLPISLYQVQMKYRDEPRPRAGLMRCREFLMKDCYSFDVDMEHARQSYDRMRDAYHRIFQRVGLDYRIVEADSGSIGGDTSAEFQILAQSGEDAIVACPSCNYAANVEVAVARIPESSADGAEDKGAPMELVETPGVKTMAKVVEFFAKEGIDLTRTIKTLIYTHAGGLAMACVRGDHEVNEVRLAQALGVDADELRLASDEEVGRAMKAKIGYIGPVPFEGRTFEGPIYVDHAVGAMSGAVAGASKTGHHLRNVAYGRDFSGELMHLRQVAEGDSCIQCGSSVKTFRGIEGGHIFILGTHYSAKMNATFLDAEGKANPFVMGCYGIGVSRLMAAAIEQHHDEGGIRWPKNIAPYAVAVLSLGGDEAVDREAERIYKELREHGIEAVLDDRDERPGVKFKDADLVGYPIRITVGKRTLKEGQAELKARSEKDSARVPLTSIVGEAVALLGKAR